MISTLRDDLQIQNFFLISIQTSKIMLFYFYHVEKKIRLVHQLTSTVLVKVLYS